MGRELENSTETSVLARSSAFFHRGVRSTFSRAEVRVPPLALGVVAAGIDSLAVLPSYDLVHQQFHTSAMAFRPCLVARDFDSFSIDLDEPSKHDQTVRHPCRLVGNTFWERGIQTYFPVKLRSAG